MQLFYEPLINVMNDKAFEYFREYLWPICNFRFLKIEDARKIDIIERVYNLRDIYLEVLEIDISNEDEYYLEQIELYFSEISRCTENTRAKLYYNKAIEIIRSEHIDIDMLEILIIIFASIVRGFYDYHIETDISFENILFGYTASERNFSPSLDDAYIMNLIRENDNLTPKSVKTRTVTKHGKTITENVESYLVHAEKNFVYMVNLLYLTHALQMVGFFEEEI